jgi:hypothetical protein
MSYGAYEMHIWIGLRVEPLSWATPLSVTISHPLRSRCCSAGESSQVGDAAVFDPLAQTQVEVLQRGEATQVGEAAVCDTTAPIQV